MDQEIEQHAAFSHGVIFPNGKRELSNKTSSSLTKEDATGLLNGSLVLYVFAKISSSGHIWAGARHQVLPLRSTPRQTNSSRAPSIETPCQLDPGLSRQPRRSQVRKYLIHLRQVSHDKPMAWVSANYSLGGI